MPEKHIMIVFSNPAEGQEEEFNEWYDKQHIPDCLATRGFVKGQRFKLADQQHPDSSLRPTDLGRQYVAIWELEADDLNEIYQNVKDAEDAGNMPVSDAFTDPNVWVFTAVTPVHTREGVEA